MIGRLSFLLYNLKCIIHCNRSLHPEKKEDLNQLRKHLVESQHEMAPMKVWQLQHLSLQAAQRIMSAPANERLSILVQTAQNFPALARSLVRIKVWEYLIY